MEISFGERLIEGLWHAVIRSKYVYDANGWDTKPVLGGATVQAEVCGRIFQPEQALFPSALYISCRRWQRGEILGRRLATQLNFPVCWNLGFRRNLNDQEIQEFASLMVKLENVRLTESKPDERIEPFKKSLL